MTVTIIVTYTHMSKLIKSKINSSCNYHKQFDIFIKQVTLT